MSHAKNSLHIVNVRFFSVKRISSFYSIQHHNASLCRYDDFRDPSSSSGATGATGVNTRRHGSLPRSTHRVRPDQHSRLDRIDQRPALRDFLCYKHRRPLDDTRLFDSSKEAPYLVGREGEIGALTNAKERVFGRKRLCRRQRRPTRRWKTRTGREEFYVRGDIPVRIRR